MRATSRFAGLMFVLTLSTASSLRAAATPSAALAPVVGRPILVVNEGARSGTDSTANARAFLADRAADLGVPLAIVDALELRAVRRGKATDVVRFRQTVGGVPVLDSEVAVSIARDGRVVFVANALRPIHGLPAREPVLDAVAARDLVRNFHGRSATPLWQRDQLVVFPGADRAILAWSVESLFDGAAGGGEWRTLVDAVSGEVFRIEDRELHADGTGEAFFPNPLASALASYGDTGFVDGADADTNELRAELESVALLGILLDSGNHSLLGPYASCLDFDVPAGTCPVQASSDFSYDSRSDDRFEAVNVYFHIDTFLRYANVTLGVPVLPYQYAGGAQFDPRGFNGADNSSYSTGSGRLRFGEGGVDDAEDADVVIHELGHGIHDWVTNGGLSQVEGLSEGLGDYFAVSYLRSYGHWQPSDPEYNWVFGWDGHNPFWGGRVTNWNDTHQYPGDLSGSIHTDGQFWSSCNLDIWDAIGRQAIDEAMLEGIAMTAGSTNQAAAAQAVLTAAVELGYSPATLDTIDAIYDACGYATGISLFIDGFETQDTTRWSGTIL